MNPRSLLAMLAAFAAVAIPAFAQTSAQPAAAQSPGAATASSGFSFPQPSCVAPKYPSKEGVTQLRAEAYNRSVEQFNRDYQAYGLCVKKYVDDSKAWVKEIADAGNKAIDDYNKFVADVKEKLEDEKK